MLLLVLAQNTTKHTMHAHLSHARSSTYKLAFTALPSSPIAAARWLPRVLLLLPMLPQLLSPLLLRPPPPPLLNVLSIVPYSSERVRYLHTQHAGMLFLL